MYKEFNEAVVNGKEYDFIANNYFNMSKEELKNILCEYIYAVHSMGIDGINEEVSDNINEMYIECDE